jgi:hypothetical protein
MTVGHAHGTITARETSHAGSFFFFDASTMPGPCNRKKQKNGNKRSRPRLSLESTSSSCTASSADSQHVPTPPPISSVHAPKVAERDAVFEEGSYAEEEPYIGEGLPQKPFIHDPGNGHRVRDTRAFLSSFFAQAPALDDPLCAEFSQDEVLQMLCTVLPEETALVSFFLSFIYTIFDHEFVDPLV